MNVDLDLTTRDLERQANQLYAMAKKEELLGRFEPAGRLREEADESQAAPARELEARH
jgi:hypothetical protein